MAAKMATKSKSEGVTEMSVEDKLKALYKLQQVDSEIDKIKILRGELPLEVQDLEDEVAGLETRINNFNAEVNSLKEAVVKKNNEILASQAMIKKYEEQQKNVRNNREYDSLSKEIEFQTLEIELSEKRKKEFGIQIEEKNLVIEESQKVLDERKADLQNKKSELDEIITDTKKEEELLLNSREDFRHIIEERLFIAYTKIRENARNGLAVVTVERDACGGCFNKIPPQRQLDIKSRKKIIVCEYCGRILVNISEEGQD
jgi:predicted  nucleic acid-binding Zn-ribbon protein